MFLLLNNPVLRKLRQRWISGVVERTLYYCGQRVGDNLRIPLYALVATTLSL